MDLQTLLESETAVWNALVDGDRAADQAHLAADFLGVYPSGFSDRDGHAGQLADGPTVAVFELHDARMLTVAPDTWLLAYRASYRRPGPGSPDEEMYVSSIWHQQGDELVNLFSQDTPVGDPTV